MVELDSWQGLADLQDSDPAQLGPYLVMSLLSVQGVTISCFRGRRLQTSTEAGSVKVNSTTDAQLPVA